jgi:hypothetical protein
MSASNLRILNCPIDAKSSSDCDPIAYVIKVGAAVFPGILIAIFLFLTIFLVCAFRFCCNCCGGRNQTANICCPPSKDKNIPARYSKNDILRAKIFMYLVAGLGVAAIIWGNDVSAQVVSGLNGFADEIKAIPDYLLDKIIEINNTLTVSLYHANTDTTETTALFANTSVMTQAQSVKNDLSSKVADQIGTFQSKINEFSFVLFIIFSVPSAVVVAGAPLALFNIRRFLPMLLVWVTFVLGTLCWIVHGTFAGTSFVIDGLCTEISGVANNRRNIISPLIGCNSDTFGAYLTSFRELRENRSEITCEKFKPLCYNSSQSDYDNVQKKQIYDCGVNDTLYCANIDLPEAVVLLRGLKIHRNITNFPRVNESGAVCISDEYKNDCTFDHCSFDCRFAQNGTLSPSGKLSKEIVSLLDAAIKVSVKIDSLGNQFANCDAILGFLLKPFDEPCMKMVKGMDGARDASGMQGFACIGGIFALIFGSKRFISSDYANKAIGEDGVEGIDAEKERRSKMAGDVPGN